MSRKLVSISCVPVVVDMNEEGEFTSAPYSPVNPGNGQSIVLNVSAKELASGWDAVAATENIFASIDKALGN